MFGILTGLPFHEIRLHAPTADYWRGRDFVALAAKLGFNTSERFIKFDPYTDKSCIMRCQREKETKHWYGWVYYDGFVYSNGNRVRLAEWKVKFRDLRITSMLQIWI